MVSIHRPPGYEPGALPLRHLALPMLDGKRSQNVDYVSEHQLPQKFWLGNLDLFLLAKEPDKSPKISFQPVSPDYSINFQLILMLTFLFQCSSRLSYFALQIASQLAVRLAWQHSNGMVSTPTVPLICPLFLLRSP